MKEMLNRTFYKTIGFYLAIATILLALVANIVYLSFDGTLLEYKNALATIPTFVGIVAYLGLLLFKKTDRYAALPLWACVFTSFMMFIAYVYMYFSAVFYNGISAEALQLIDSKIIVTIVFYVLASITGNVAIYCKAESKNKNVDQKAEG